MGERKGDWGWGFESPTTRRFATHPRRGVIFTETLTDVNMRYEHMRFEVDSQTARVLACCFACCRSFRTAQGAPKTGRIGKRVRFPHGPATVMLLRS